MEKRYKYILIAIVFLVILFTAGVFVYIETTRGVGKLKIVTMPGDTNYSVGGKRYSGNQEISLKSGGYTITFSRVFYQSTTKHVEVTRNQSATLEISLPVDETAIENTGNLAATDQATIDTSEQLSAIADRERFREDNPIIEILPLISSNYRIDYGIYGEGAPTIEITIFSEALSTTNADTLKKAALKEISMYNIDAKKIVWYEESRASFN